ncbi:hypothetical protein [Brachybacterium sp. YJGR34]|uniref:hypothetical protein n=1 Tax=Brachybacterium sp. YJGR34 TaxID=2059911 RepID=UPI000E0C48C3|nr:hypothetical protein [Brachybacterium sp. YJGR34]
MSTETTAADLLAVVHAVPGVQGVEPGITTTLRALDARLRRDSTSRDRYGLHVDAAARTVVIEVALAPVAPVRDIVEALQTAVQDALDDSDATPGPERPWEVTVRVQSISARPADGGDRRS